MQIAVQAFKPSGRPVLYFDGNGFSIVHQEIVYFGIAALCGSRPVKQAIALRPASGGKLLPNKLLAQASFVRCHQIVRLHDFSCWNAAKMLHDPDVGHA